MSSKYSAERFTEACGSAGPLQLSVDDSTRSGPTRRVFQRPCVLIGRDPKVDLLLEHWRVSRRHAYLQLVAGRLFCVDLGSRTGTIWDDGGTEAGWLDPDRSIQIGPFEIGRWYEPQPATPVDMKGPGFDVEFLTGGAAPPSVHVTQNLSIIGSSPACRVCIPQSDVSKAHCSLLHSGRGLWVVDLLGRGGIFVNEIQVPFAEIEDGDELRIGRQVVRFRLHEAKSVAEATPGRWLARRDDEAAGTVGIAEVKFPPSGMPEPTSATVPMIPLWRYPEDEVERVLAERPSSQAELIQALMQPMVQQFGLMQQQMFEQFHQAMMGMLQSFGSFHREQMADLREEIDEVRRLTQELQEAQDESRRREARDARRPPAAPAPLPRSHPARAPDDRFTPPPSPAHARGQTATGAKSEPRIDPARRSMTTATDPAVHGLLTARIAQLQNERQSRWQKILGMLNRPSQ